ncbi:uncharacterized protein TNCV_2097791 [Trichonephila clavipes]|nr:uncharacterized protein TNCV_2097791 [Trichonephila clavipes]
MVRRKREAEMGERGHYVTYVISVKKLDNCPRLRLINLPTFRLGVLFPQTREHNQRSYQLHCQHYGVDQGYPSQMTLRATSEKHYNLAGRT